MAKRSDVLARLHARLVAQRFGPLDHLASLRGADSRIARQIERMAARGIVTVGDLVDELPRLARARRESSLRLIGMLGIRQAVPVLVDLLALRSTRLLCADVLSQLAEDPRVAPAFLETGLRELRSAPPDRHWLEVVVRGLGGSNEVRATELLVAVFERTDLPGWLRGDAGDKLGGHGHSAVRDRRTKLFRRCRDAAVRGLREDDIDVQFHSMYVLAKMALGKQGRPRPRHGRAGLEGALPALRRIRADDHRLAPGYWWPMSAEAEDTLHAFATGRVLVPEAAERWLDVRERGAWNRD